MVSLDGAGGASLLVPATFVQRRFPHGSTVHAHRGTTDGLVSGVLEDSSSSDLNGCPSTAISSMPLELETRKCDSKKLAAPTENPDSSNVDHQDSAVCFAVRVERVPSHLIGTSEKP